jgi:AcrR family transcriptional regulator/DNA-binding transcriptional ArsR family regulator
MLRPGPGTPPEEVARNQKERLFGAMVASVAERGYTATRVTDLVELSGVSRRSFYMLYEDKEACFRATVEALFTTAIERAAAYESAGSTWEQRALSGFNEFASMVVEQPAAAKMSLIEAFAAGPEAMKPFELAAITVEGLTKARLEESPLHAGMPDELITAFVGASVEIVRDRVGRDEERELPAIGTDLVNFFLSYRPPPEPLRMTTRPPLMAPEAIEAHDHGERALRGLAAATAEHGYANVTVDQIVKRAAMSPTTFYANFSSKEDAMMAAIDSAGARITGAVLPAFRRNPDYPSAVRAAFGALFNFLASRPALAQLVTVEVYAAGPTATQRRKEALADFQTALFGGGLELTPEVPPIAIEAIIGGIQALAYKQVHDHGPESLSALAPVATYFALLPFVGPEVACEAANGDGHSRNAAPVLADGENRVTQGEIIRALGDQPATAEEISRRLEMPVDASERQLTTLEEAGLVEVAERRENGDGTVPLYRSQLRRLESEWHAMDQPNRERISQRIVELIRAEMALAIESKTFDGRSDRFLTRTPLKVDDQGWRELIAIHRDALDASLRVRDESKQRLDGSGEPAVEGLSVQTLFEMPPPPPAQQPDT